MTTRVGRTIPSSAVIIPGVTTASAYSAWDAVGSSFQIPYAAGADGGVIGTVNLLDLGTANGAYHIHLFSNVPSAQVDGATWTLATADFPIYLGYVNVQTTDWQTAGATRNQARITGENLAINGVSGGRATWGQVQCVNAPTMGAVANPLWFNQVTLQD